MNSVSFPWYLTSLKSTADPDQAEPGYHSTSNFSPVPDEQIFQSFGDVGRPEQPNGGFHISHSNFNWPAATNVAAHQPQDFNRDTMSTLSINQGFDGLINPISVSQPHQWNAGPPFPTNSLPTNNFGALPPSNLMEHVNTGTGVMQGNLSYDAMDEQSTVPPSGTQVVRGG